MRTDGLVQADAGGERNADIRMAHDAKRNAAGRACLNGFGHE
jgi:hypothetical protein